MKLPDLLTSPDYSSVESLIHQKEVELIELKNKFEVDSYQ